jgi:hypothetical protein
MMLHTKLRTSYRYISIAATTTIASSIDTSMTSTSTVVSNTVTARNLAYKLRLLRQHATQQA